MISNDNKFGYIAVVLLAILVITFVTLLLVGTDGPLDEPPLTFSHRWGICTLSLSCDNCLEEHNYLNKSLSICWEKMDMDGHVEIFGR